MCAAVRHCGAEAQRRSIDRGRKRRTVEATEKQNRGVRIAALDEYLEVEWQFVTQTTPARGQRVLSHSTAHQKAQGRRAKQLCVPHYNTTFPCV